MNLLKNIKPQDKFIALFILKGLALYLVWFLIYDNWLLKDGLIDHFLIQHLVDATQFFLNAFGYETFQYADSVGVDGTHGVLIGAPCNGMALFALFTGFILIFPGKIKHKLFFIPVGLLIIHILNIIRLVGLAMIVVYFPKSLEFNHKYTFTFIVYAVVFLMWVIWIKKYSIKK